jgi:hypothetical protein
LNITGFSKIRFNGASISFEEAEIDLSTSNFTTEVSFLKQVTFHHNVPLIPIENYTEDSADSGRIASHHWVTQWAR